MGALCTLLYNSKDAVLTRSRLPGFALLNISRNATIAASVVLLHVGLVYALYSGLLTRAVELVVPVAMLSQLIEPPPPKTKPPLLPTEPAVLQPAPPRQIKKAITPTPAAVTPLPLAINDPIPAPNAPSGSIDPQPPTAALATAPVATARSVAPAAPVVQLPSSDAEYLKNPPPPYPAISRRLNEQGKTMVRVLIGADGQPQRAEIAKSSGFARLDDAALSAVMGWRYVPGKRGGVAEPMWFVVPLKWELVQ